MNIVLKRIKEGDLETIRKWRMLPEVTKYMFTDPDIILEDQESWYKNISADPTCAYWIIQVDSTDIGLVYLTNIDKINKRANFSFYIADTSMRGKGIGKQLELNMQYYVFSVLNLSKLCCELFAWNKDVISMHQHLGAKIEGVRRAHIYKGGHFHDTVEMAILRDEWEQIKKNNTRVPAIFEE